MKLLITGHPSKHLPLSQDYEEGCSLLQQCGVIGRSDEEVYVRDDGQETIAFLKAIMQPFVESYQVISVIYKKFPGSSPCRLASNRMLNTSALISVCLGGV